MPIIRKDYRVLKKVDAEFFPIRHGLVTLKTGWCFADGSHSMTYIDINVVIAAMKTVAKCDCDDCRKNIAMINSKKMEWVRNDGGRAEAGYKGSAGDCVARSIAIASGRPYQEVYDALSKGEGKVKKNGVKKAASAANGILVGRKWFKDYMKSIGFEWTPTMMIGSGCKVRLSKDELPKGKIIASVSKHYVAVIDGVIHDTHNPQRDTGRCVYGYWRLAE